MTGGKLSEIASKNPTTIECSLFVIVLFALRYLALLDYYVIWVYLLKWGRGGGQEIIFQNYGRDVTMMTS